MEPSEEIRRILDRWLVAFRDGDCDTYVARISEHAGVLVVGTDEEEWWHQGDVGVLEQQFEESGGFPVGWSEIEAWEEGTVGWAGAKLTLTGPEETYLIRLTWVLHLERGEWKIVQGHFSVGRPSVEILGKELTVSLEQLEQTIRQERPDLSDTLAADGTVTTSRRGLRAGDPGRDRQSLRRCLRATPGADRDPYRRRPARGRPLLRHDRALRGARRQQRARRRGAGLEPRARVGRRLGPLVPREPRGRVKGLEGSHQLFAVDLA